MFGELILWAIILWPIVPIGTFVFFIVSLILFIVARKRCRSSDSEEYEKKYLSRKTRLIVSAVILVAVTLVTIALTVLIIMALANM